MTDKFDPSHPFYKTPGEPINEEPEIADFKPRSSKDFLMDLVHGPEKSEKSEAKASAGPEKNIENKKMEEKKELLGSGQVFASQFKKKLESEVKKLPYDKKGQKVLKAVIEEVPKTGMMRPDKFAEKTLKKWKLDEQHAPYEKKTEIRKKEEGLKKLMDNK